MIADSESVLQAGVIQCGTPLLNFRVNQGSYHAYNMSGKKPIPKYMNKQASSALLSVVFFLGVSDSFIANYNQSHYKISSPTPEFLTCDNHLPATQQFTFTSILQTLNSAHNICKNSFLIYSKLF